MEKLKFDKNSLKKFGIIMGIAFLVIASSVFLKHRRIPHTLAVISGMFFVFSLISPLLLKPIYVVWMRMAFCLGWVNTRLILFIIFYLVFTPLGLVLRLFRFDLLDKKMDNRASYWKNKEKTGFKLSNYERRF